MTIDQDQDQDTDVSETVLSDRAYGTLQKFPSLISKRLQDLQGVTPLNNCFKFLSSRNTAGLEIQRKPSSPTHMETREVYIDESLFRFAWNVLPNNDSSVKLRKKDYVSQKYDLKFLHLLHIPPKTIIINRNSIHKSIAYHVC